MSKITVHIINITFLFILKIMAKKSFIDTLLPENQNRNGIYISTFTGHGYLKISGGKIKKVKKNKTCNSFRYQH